MAAESAIQHLGAARGSTSPAPEIIGGRESVRESKGKRQYHQYDDTGGGDDGAQRRDLMAISVRDQAGGRVVRALRRPRRVRNGIV